jgi:hexulose-6-phosphate isomerase
MEAWGGDMKKGLNGWTFPVELPIAEAARTAAAAGFEVFEPTLNRTGDLTAETEEEACRRLGDTIREAGLEVGSLACGMFWQSHYAAPDAETREAARRLTLACLERAQWLGAPVVLVVPAVVSDFNRPKTPIVGYAEALQLSSQALRELAPAAEAFGVTLAVENVWNQFLLSPVEMREYVDRINSPWVTVYFDVGNILKYGFPEDWIETLAGRITRVHVKDYKLSVGTFDGFCALGEGDVNWPAVMQALRTVGYDGPLTYEGPGDPADIARRIDRILGGQG